jgi:hypothetical protein
MYISLHFFYILYIFCCILYIFAVFSKKYRWKIYQWSTILISLAHLIRGAPKWGAPQILCMAHALGCATGTTHSRGACRCAPQIKYTSGLICVAHHRCATKPQNGAPQIGFFLVVKISTQWYGIINIM